MKLRFLLLIIVIFSQLYHWLIRYINMKQRQKPLPKEVSDIYDEARYQQYLSYTNDYLRPAFISDMIGLLVSFILLMTPFFNLMETLGHHQIIQTLIVTVVITSLMSIIPETIMSYYQTFVIEERYGKNRKTKKLFFKELCIDSIFSLILEALVLMLLYIVIHYVFMKPIHKPLFVLIIILIVITVTYLVMNLFSYFYLHIQYKFTPLPEGDLKNAILDLMKDSRKKVSTINVYNESAKSTSKNAFLLKMPFHKEFGIADNFLTGNSYDELLAVLSHEVGHLKHRKNIWNYLNILFIIGLIILLYILLSHPHILISILSVIQTSFHLSADNVYLDVYVIGILLTPLGALLEVYHNYVSRKEEYEADDNAVKEGYGQALISTFKQLSGDELIDVNPADITEFLEYDHPGMYHRITHIQKEMEKHHEKTDPQ